jgi:hypothetical protein
MKDYSRCFFFHYKSFPNCKPVRSIFISSISCNTLLKSLYDSFTLYEIVHWHNMTVCNLMQRPGTKVCLCVSVCRSAVEPSYLRHGCKRRRTAGMFMIYDSIVMTLFSWNELRTAMTLQYMSQVAYIYIYIYTYIVHIFSTSLFFTRCL